MIRQHSELSRNGGDSADGSTQGSTGTDPVIKSAQKTNEVFRKFSHKTSAIVGSPWAFAIAVASIIVWAVLGRIYHYSDTWQLVINTATTIVTFLMVFLIQNTQNRDARAIHLKLDELIRGNKRTRNRLVDLEDCTEEELEQIEKEFKRVRERAQRGETPGHAAAGHPHKAHETVKTLADSPGRG